MLTATFVLSKLSWSWVLSIVSRLFRKFKLRKQSVAVTINVPLMAVTFSKIFSKISSRVMSFVRDLSTQPALRMASSVTMTTTHRHTSTTYHHNTRVQREDGLLLRVSRLCDHQTDNPQKRETDYRVSEKLKQETDRISEKLGATDHLPFVSVCCHELAPQVERSFENQTKHRSTTCHKVCHTGTQVQLSDTEIQSCQHTFKNFADCLTFPIQSTCQVALKGDVQRSMDFLTTAEVAGMLQRKNCHVWCFAGWEVTTRLLTKWEIAAG